MTVDVCQLDIGEVLAIAALGLMAKDNEAELMIQNTSCDVLDKRVLYTRR